MSQEARKAILVADQDEGFRRLLAAAFSDEPYDLLLAANAQEAWEQVERASCDLILLEATLPGLDGYRFCRSLKGRDQTRHVPVIVLGTASTCDEEDILKGFEQGAADMLCKPLSIAYLKTKIRIWLSRGERQGDS